MERFLIKNNLKFFKSNRFFKKRKKIVGFLSKLELHFYFLIIFKGFFSVGFDSRITKLEKNDFKTI